MLYCRFFVSIGNFQQPLVFLHTFVESLSLSLSSVGLREQVGSQQPPLVALIPDMASFLANIRGAGGNSGSSSELNDRDSPSTQLQSACYRSASEGFVSPANTTSITTDLQQRHHGLTLQLSASCSFGWRMILQV
jgi:hypothetical protein